MRRKTLFHIVTEGWLVLAGLAIACAVINAVVGFWAGVIVLAVMTLAVLYFRDSPRNVPAEPLSVIAPVDGVIVHRRECYDPYLDREAIKLTIQLDWFGAYLLRSPVEGRVLELPGETVLEMGGVASWIRTDERDDLVMAIRRGTLFGQQPCRNGYGERLGQGRCCGYRRLARRVELFLPVNSRLEVELGDRVRAGTQVLAKLVHKKKECRPETAGLTPDPGGAAAGAA
ncbi:MAG: hypothetical protein PF501_04800 [Salinisphaera sp.]|jgi:phosphatidylserine decarboxylase|nr:hypothetical protein [Salinisphaera sp.]